LWSKTAIVGNDQEEMMSVRLRVAGIFYDEKFEFSVLRALIPAIDLFGRTVPSTTEPTIFELLEAATRSPGTNKKNFFYAFERRNISKPAKSVLSMVSLGVTHKKPIAKTIGGDSRPAGTYQLTETPFPSGITAWQYYVYRNGVSVSQLKPPPPNTGYSPAVGTATSSFTGFDRFKLKDGDEVIWRLVSILREPNSSDPY
jgi:hypothetical protein